MASREMGKYGEMGRAFSGFVCPVCEAHVWRVIPDGPMYEEGGTVSHEHPIPPQYTDGEASPPLTERE